LVASLKVPRKSVCCFYGLGVLSKFVAKNLSPISAHEFEKKMKYLDDDADDHHGRFWGLEFFRFRFKLSLASYYVPLEKMGNFGDGLD